MTAKTEAKIKPELDYYNTGHIKEPAAYAAFSHKEEREAMEYDLELLRESLAFAKRIFKNYGFEVVEHIKLQSVRTGRIYR